MKLRIFLAVACLLALCLSAEGQDSNVRDSGRRSWPQADEYMLRAPGENLWSVHRDHLLDPDGNRWRIEGDTVVGPNGERLNRSEFRLPEEGLTEKGKELLKR